ncbi:hypothetical protein DFH07DRAFT_892494 [Mycena maculata]|uniref:F-box domain-containing protein n=1 Tax=Mycena maculata TaxID=230809 RepID=A0AAD7ICX0_9AGAR|nr:hypothetical protein DFH07DRAFT_892494 [Mycena maculata]
MRHMVMSVAALQEHIDKLAADIVRQESVLKDLWRSKGAAQRQLNAIRDPMARMPLEISSEIFLQCRNSRPEPSADQPPLLFLNICNGWRDIALSTPALWSAIHADKPKDDLGSILVTWLKRAGGRALSISLPTPVTRDIAQAIGYYTHQLQDLGMFHDADDIRLIAAKGPFVFLETLTLAGVPTDSVPRCSISHTIEMLDVCPNINEYTLANVFYADDYYDHDHFDIRVLPCIQHFNLGRPDDASASSAVVLRRISLPSLKTFYLPVTHDLPFPKLIQFFTRSLPPLQKFIVGGGSWNAEWTLSEMKECLALLPTLTHFEVQPIGQHVADGFITTLGSSPHLLPNASAITFQPFYPPVEWYQKLLTVLSARRDQIRIVQVIWADNPYQTREAPPQDVCVRLRQLAADGMEIHIGTEQRNYI